MMKTRRVPCMPNAAVFGGAGAEAAGSATGAHHATTSFEAYVPTPNLLEDWICPASRRCRNSFHRACSILRLRQLQACPMEELNLPARAVAQSYDLKESQVDQSRPT